MAHLRYNPLRDYLVSIGQYEVLTRDQEIELATKMRDESDPVGAAMAREKLINHNLKLVVSIAKRYKNAHMTMLDIIGEGNSGLIIAAERFNPELGYRFSTCATPWIKQAILKAITDKGRTVRLPAHMFQLMSKYKAAIAELQQKGEQITDEKLADMINTTTDKIVLLRESKHDAASLDTPLSDEADADTMADLVMDDRETPDEYADRLNSQSAIIKAIHTLKPRTQTIIKMRFGIAEKGDPAEYAEPHTLEEVGAYLNLTRERIRQIEKEALIALKPVLEAMGLGKNN